MENSKIEQQKRDAQMERWVNIGSLLTDIANALDSVNDCDAPNAMHAKVVICEKIIDIINSVEV